ncbi:MAG: hypothetical protein IAE67_11330 [Candidatus Competibacteraceae bacterium]|nr:hypothetical protein [Candidatus Competibacteraceae bacterium]
MKNLILSVCMFVFLLFVSVLNTYAATRKTWTWRVVAATSCYQKYICDLRSTQDVCKKGTQTGEECHCPPWNCLNS